MFILKTGGSRTPKSPDRRDSPPTVINKTVLEPQSLAWYWLVTHKGFFSPSFDHTHTHIHPSTHNGLPLLGVNNYWGGCLLGGGRLSAVDAYHGWALIRR
jgi:hypothetical protein